MVNTAVNTAQIEPFNRGAALRPKEMRVYLAQVNANVDEPGYQPPEYWPRLIPQVFRWRSNGGMSSLTLRLSLGRSPDGSLARWRPERTEFYPGPRVILRSTIEPGWEEDWFVGNIAQRRMVIQANPDHEELMLTAYGPELLLENKVVSGQWHKYPAIDDKEIAGTSTDADKLWSTTNGFRSDIPVIFNEHGYPNATQTNWWINPADADNVVADDQKCKLFEPSMRDGRRVERIVSGVAVARIQAVSWTAYTALRTLVELIDGYDVIARETNWQSIEDLLKVDQSDATSNAIPIGEVNVEGKSLLEAIRAILLPVGFGFALYPRPIDIGKKDSAPDYRYKLHVFSLHPEVKKVNEDGTEMATKVPVGRPHLAGITGGNVDVTSDEGQASTVQRIDFLEDAHQVKNEVTVKGSPLIVQKVIDTMVGYPLWDTSTHDLKNWDTSNVISPYELPGGSYTETVWRRDYNHGGSASGAHDHLAKYPQVFRAFSWNEDASAEIKTYPDGLSGAASTVSPPNLSATNLDMGETNKYVRRPRVPRPTLTKIATESGGTATQVQKVHGAKVFFGIVASGTLDEDSWIDVTNDFAIDRERAMITVKRSDILDWFPWRIDSQPRWCNTYAKHTYATLLHNALRAGAATPALRIRLVASFESDLRLKSTASRNTDTAWPFKSERVLINPRFRQHVIGDTWITGADTAAHDDGNIVADYATRAQDAAEDSMGHCSMVLRGTTLAYPIGMAIPSTSGRVVDLTIDGGRQSYAPVVIAVSWDLRESANKTELQLDSPLLGLPA